jgi:hypothetical protein
MNAFFEISEEILNSIQEYNDNQYDLKHSIEESKTILEVEMSHHSLSNCVFEENHWYIEDPLQSLRYKIDFDEIKDIIRFNKDLLPNFIDIIKCWTASLIETNSALFIKHMIGEGLRNFFILTKGLTLKNKDHLFDDFSIMSTGRKQLLCISALNFCDYYSEIDEEFIIILHDLKKSFDVKGNARLLPPSKDILIFSKVLEEYFSNTISNYEYLKWFPIWLWWNLTTIIPLRPSEYCLIDRNCLFKKNGAFYIKLPRKKLKKVNGRQIQRISEVYIPERLYNKIEEYIQRTEEYGKTDTLISYYSIPESWYDGYKPNRHQGKKLNPNKFSLPIFRTLLNSFYEQIVLNSWFGNQSESDNFIQDIQRVRPGDTRHIAFINLKRLGYHPVEIARLGGHTHLQSQEFYFNHISSFVDLEIMELVTNTDLNEHRNDAKHDNQLGSAFVEKYILRPTMSTAKIKLDDGFCTDPIQNCKVEDCWECNSWRISQEEFISKKHILIDKMKKSQSHINEVVENLKKLYQSIYSNMRNDEFLSELNPEIKKQLINYSKRIDDAVYKHINLLKVKERIDNIGYKG